MLTAKLLGLTLLMFAAQVPGTTTPLFLFPDVTSSGFLVPALEGQYILKPIVMVSTALTTGATVRASAGIDHSEVSQALVFALCLPLIDCSLLGSPSSPR